MLWAMAGMLVAIWAVLAVPFVLFAVLRRRKAARRAASGAKPRAGAPS